jgi:hypothetical protein
MHLVCALLAPLAAPFWETKTPGDRTDAQIELAEAEWARRRGKPLNDACCATSCIRES